MPEPTAVIDSRRPARSLKRTSFPRFFRFPLRYLASRRNRRWDQALANVQATQEGVLQSILRHAADTEFGQKHGFRQIRSYADFRERVPRADYDTYVPAFERMMRGETGILLPEFIKFWGNSSGSTNQHRQKFLPVSETQIRYQKGAGFDVLARYLRNHPEHADWLSGYSMGLFPPPNFKPTERVMVTNNPGLMSTRMPAMIRPIYLPNAEIKAIENYDEKLEKIAATYLDYDIRAVSGTTCWFSVLFDKILAAAKKQGRPETTVGEIWPNLRVLLGGGVAAGPYRDVIRDRVGHDIYLCDTYNATEGGIFATTDSPEIPGMLMIPDRGVFFEFVPVEELHDDEPTRVPLWEVEPGQVYSILLTTTSGLYSYQIGDLVRFPSIAPHRIEFVGRTQGNLSVTQELTTHVEIQQSIEAAILAHPCQTVDFAAGAEVGVAGTAKPRYLLFVEFVPGEAPADLDGFAASFDEKLCELNRVYREHRKDNVGILAPKLHVLPAGSVTRYMSEVGGANVQSKFPRIVNDERRDILLSWLGE